MNTQYTTKQVYDLLQLCHKYNLAFVSRNNNIHESTLKEWRKRYGKGMFFPEPEYTEDEIREAKNLRKRGNTLAKISSITGIRKEYLTRYIEPRTDKNTKKKQSYDYDSEQKTTEWLSKAW